MEENGQKMIFRETVKKKVFDKTANTHKEKQRNTRENPDVVCVFFLLSCLLFLLVVLTIFSPPLNAGQWRIALHESHDDDRRGTTTGTATARRR